MVAVSLKKDFFQAEDGIRDTMQSRGLGDVYKRQSLPSPSHPQPLWTASVGDDRAGRDSGRGEGRESSTVSGGDETLTTPHDVTFARFDRLSALERSSARKAEGDTTATLWLLHCWGWKPPLYQRSSVETVASSLIISRVRRVALL